MGMRGVLAPPDSRAPMAHGAASSTGRTVYLSPALEMAGHPVYSSFFQLGKRHWAQVVLECRVRPGSFRVQPSTLWHAHWPQHVRMDPNFPTNDTLEWLIDEPSDVVVSAVMIREFGPGVDQIAYGACACQVSDSIQEAFSWKRGSGPEYAWTRLRSREFASQGLLVRR